MPAQKHGVPVRRYRTERGHLFQGIPVYRIVKDRNYLVFVFSTVLVVVFVSILASGAGAGDVVVTVVVVVAPVVAPLESTVTADAVIVSTAGVVAGVSVIVVALVAVESLEDVSVVLLPQDATKRPIDSASIDNFTNFIVSLFYVVMQVYTRKGIR